MDFEYGTILESFVRDRNKALFSLNEKKIRIFCTQYGIELASDAISFWGGVYKSILHIPSAPEELRVRFREWLKDHNLSESIS